MGCDASTALLSCIWCAVPSPPNCPLPSQAYRDLARLTHPDKVQGDGPEKEAAQKKFLDVAEAYEVCFC